MLQQTLNVLIFCMTTKIFVVLSSFKVNFDINNYIISTLNFYDVHTTRRRNESSYFLDTSLQRNLFEIMTFLINHA